MMEVCFHLAHGPAKQASFRIWKLRWGERVKWRKYLCTLPI
jgi:hypothetical protein